MALAERYDIDLTDIVRRRGEQYAREGRVRIDELGETSARLLARGSTDHTYRVDIHRQGDRLTATCTCPSSIRAGSCKHVWAALLVLEAKADDWLPSGVVAVHAGEPAEELDDDGSDEDDIDADNGASETEAAPRRRANAPDWQRVLDRVKESSGPYRPGGGVEGRRDRELWFGLNLRRTERSGRLTIDFYHRVRRRHGPWGQIKSLAVTDEVLEQLTGTADGDLLEFLVGNHIDIDGLGSNAPMRILRVRLRPTLYEPCLSRLAASGRFRVLRDRPDSLERAAAVEWTPEDPWRLELSVTHDASVNAWWLTGLLAAGSTRIELNEPDAIPTPGSAPPAWRRMVT